MKCTLSIQKDGKPAKAEVSFENAQVTIATFSRPSASPRLKQYPSGTFGSDPLCFMGHRILEFVSEGYSINREDEELGHDRISSTLDIAPNLIATLLPQLVNARALPELMKGRKILHERLLVSYEQAPQQHRLVLTFLRSGLSPEIATRLALAYRCAVDEGTTRTNDFTGLFCDLPSIVKPLRDFNRLEPSVLDQFENLGLPLRPLDYRVLHEQSAFAGFVGF